MIWLILFVILSFSVSVFIGPPFLPTLDKQRRIALDLLNLKPGQVMLELGSGDGRVLKEAAKRGIKVVGYEINPILVVTSYLLTFKYRKNVQIIWGNFWTKRWPEADGIFVFLHSKYMKKLDNKAKSTSKPLRLVSVIYQIPDKSPAKSKHDVFLYIY